MGFQKGHGFIGGGIKKGSGFVPWNKGTKGIMKPNSGSFKKGEHRSIKTEFKEGGKPRWKGEKAGYVSKHEWIYTNKGSPDTCEHCEKKGLAGHKIHWANKDHKYSRNLEDYLRLCAKCHINFDKQSGLRK
jgi:hypothetical protein